jgi:hypothetical protein
MKRIKSWKTFEAISSIEELEGEVGTILLELEDKGMVIEMSRVSQDNQMNPEDKWLKKAHTDVFLEVYIRRPWGSPDREMPNLPTPPTTRGKYPGNLLFWFELKETIIRLTEWYYSNSIWEPGTKNPKFRWEQTSPLRFFGSGIEFAIGFSKEEDFSGINDEISLTNLRILIKL